MKKLFLLVAVVAMILPSCGKINDAIDELGNRLDKLEQETIPSIDEQISAINTTLDNLDAMDKELKDYIDNLTTTALSLQEQINATNTKIDNLKTELEGEISTAKAVVLAQLDATKTELEGELSQINATIATLKAKDAELDNKIAELRSYVDAELGKTTDWANATFATLEQYNTLVSEIATIKEQIKAINQSITNLETRLTTKINEDIATAVSTLNADIQQKVKDITDDYTNAVQTAKEEITDAYTAAIQTAINTLDTSLKSWVGEQLSNYYTIAEVEAKILALQNALTAGDTALQEELNKLKTELETAKVELSEAYKKAIEEAIDTNNGVVDTKIANEIAAVNNRVNSEVATINAKIATIEARLDKVEADIASLLKRIQSVTYIPQFNDGKATVYYSSVWHSYTVLDFEIKPNEIVSDIVELYPEICSVKAVYTQTRAVEFVELPIINCIADPENGVLSLTVACDKLSEEFFAGRLSASVSLSIANESSNIASAYIPIVPKEEIPANNEIWYTSTDGNIATPTNAVAKDANILSNTYKNGRGVLTFDAPITSIAEEAFIHNSKITSIVLPEGVVTIRPKAFYDCSELVSVTLPASITAIDTDNFDVCRKLRFLRGPLASADQRCFIINGELVTFADSGLTTYSIPSEVIKIGYYVFDNCVALTTITIPSGVAEIAVGAFANCLKLTSITIPDSIISIGDKAFQGCTSLQAVICEPTTPPIGGNGMFNNNGEGRTIYVPDTAVEEYKSAIGWSAYASSIVGTTF